MDQSHNETATSSDTSDICKGIGALQNNADVIFGHRHCQTREVKWLCIEHIYQKFHRPNYYDIGGTYVADVPDFWFTCRTEQVGDIFLLHIFIYKLCEGRFSFIISGGAELKIDKKSKAVKLSKPLKQYEFDNIVDNRHTGPIEDRPEVGCLDYVCTYNFSNLDVGFMKDKLLFIEVAFPRSSYLNLNVTDKVKTQHTFEDLLTNPVDTDFTMESSSGEQFKVHRAILAAHSDVFKAMFREETIESQTQTVKLVDVSSEDLKHLIEYLYTGYLKDMDNADFVHLLMIADRYNLKGLRHLAQCALAAQLTIDNALYILVISDLYDSDFLKNEAFKFIKKNKETLKMSTFKDVSNANLVRELCTYLVNDD